MHWDMCECCVWVAIDDDGGSDAVLELADLRDERLAIADDRCWSKGGIDDADVATVIFWNMGRAFAVVRPG